MKKRYILILVLVTLVAGGIFAQATGTADVTFICTRTILGTKFRFDRTYTVTAANDNDAIKKAYEQLTGTIFLEEVISTNVRWHEGISPAAPASEYYNLANSYADNGDYDRAINFFNQAIQRNSNNANYYGERGRAYHIKGDYDRAIADYTQAIRLNSRSAVYYSNRALAYNNKGDYDRAIADATEAIRLDSNFQFAYRERAYAYTQKGNYTQARADVNRALWIDPNYESAKTLDASLKQRENASTSQAQNPQNQSGVNFPSDFLGTWRKQ